MATGPVEQPVAATDGPAPDGGSGGASGAPGEGRAPQDRLHADERVVRLEAELVAARERIAALELQLQREHAAAEEAERLSLFTGDPPPDRLTGDGSDPRVLSLALGATAVVAAMVTLLTLLNGKIGSVFGVVMVALTVGLAWAAARTRVVPVEVSVVRGIVYVERGESTHRFDLRKPETKVEVEGRPGDGGWAVRFVRRGLDPFVVDASMVDPEDFLRQLREFRPELG